MYEGENNEKNILGLATEKNQIKNNNDSGK